MSDSRLVTHMKAWRLTREYVCEAEALVRLLRHRPDLPQHDAKGEEVDLAGGTAVQRVAGRQQDQGG